jgi:ectoine hydroxylase-related dioxygenase (phytanoyl-CoA dioxygenase family)
MQDKRSRMDDWFNAIAADCCLPSDVARELHSIGFVVVPGPVAQPGLSQFVAAYDAAVSGAHSDDVSIGSSTTRVNDLVNRGPDFDGLYVYRPILGACCSIIGQPFKLSTMHARTVNPRSSPQALHVDFPRRPDGWPPSSSMLGFIIMVDEFRSDNGATRFVPGSHLWPHVPADLTQDPTTEYPGQVSVCGAAGSVVIYNGSVWHGHSANQTDQPRRSIQGAYIQRDAQSAVNQAARIRPETLSRIGPAAKYLLGL